MKNANEMREIVNQVFANKQEAAKKEAINICETVISKEIEFAAGFGALCVEYSVPNNISLDYVVAHLESNGYEVKGLMGRSIRIIW